MRRRKHAVNTLVPVFVDGVPRRLAEGRLYVSLRYRTVAHLCACGYGVEVNTPLHPTGWAITYDGVNVSLRPSVGNWSEDCGSHYIIDKNRVRWARSWSRAEILEERSTRRDDIRTYHSDEAGGEAGLGGRDLALAGEPRGRVERVVAWLRRRWTALGRR